MVFENRISLSRYLLDLLAQGQVVFTAEQAAAAIGVTHGAFLDAVERLQSRHAVISPRRGFYVIVPPQFALWQAPPPEWYVDALMRHEHAPYYVGLLKAAEFYGAAHQAVMAFQVMSTKRIPDIRAGRNRLVFYFRKDITALRSGLVARKTDTGSMFVSSAALTALDLLRYPQACAGISHIATVLEDLAPAIKKDDLRVMSDHFETPVIQRVGFLLELQGAKAISDCLSKSLESRGSARWIELDTKASAIADLALPVLERNSRWHVVVRRYPRADQ
jgi:predicted transcriptional regulator of viral defense system